MRVIPRSEMKRLKLDIPATAGLFYSLEDTEKSQTPGLFHSKTAASGQGYALFTRNTLAGEVIVSGVIPMSCMFKGYFLSPVEDINEHIGYYFTSQFPSSNNGGYIISMLDTKRKATSAEILLKTKEVIILNYPNTGTLIISPSVSEDVHYVFEEQ